jgi:hypothetical protein
MSSNHTRAGEHCEPITSTGSSDNTTAIVLGIVLPLVFLLLIFAVIAALLMWGFMKYKQPKLVLKVHQHQNNARASFFLSAVSPRLQQTVQEPNYQVLVWRRESMESEKRSILPKKLNVKVSAVLEKVRNRQHDSLHIVVFIVSLMTHAQRATSSS